MADIRKDHMASTLGVAPHESPGISRPVGGERHLRESAPRLKILHVINNLAIGGAEVMLYKLLCELDGERFDHVVVSLMERNTLSKQIEALNIPVYHLGMRPGRLSPAQLWRLARVARQVKPDLIHGWLYHGSLAAQLAALCSARKVPVLWGIHSTVYSVAFEKRLTAAVIKMCAPLSKLAAKVIFVSQTSLAQHEALGFSVEKSCVFPNGIETATFVPSPEARALLRAELGLPDDCLLIGLIGRYHPMKDHPNFLQAAALLTKTHPDVHFVLVGRDITPVNEELRGRIQAAQLNQRVHLLGERRDIHLLAAALDILSLSSSHGESFPIIVAEAMSCGVPCVVTDIGDLAAVVGDTGRVVPPRDAAALAVAWSELIDLEPEQRRALGRRARQRALEHFDIASVAARYRALYLGSVQEPSGDSRAVIK
jgi:glycosyltransferase involved in cell wall biosynthesis